MKIWILEIGEPLPPEKDVRLHRYGQFTQYLAANGFEPTWWTSSFSHAPKKHFADIDSEVSWNGVKVKYIRGIGYQKNISMARIRHNRHFAKRFLELAATEEPPDLIIAPVPIIEAAVAAMKYANPRNIPVLMDIRDLWPDELKNIAPKPLRGLARLALTNAYKNMGFVCQRATGIMGVSESYVAYGLKFAGRARGPADTVFPLGYSLKLPDQSKIIEAEAWLESKGVIRGKFTASFFGTIGKFFDLKPVIEAFGELGTELPVQLLIGGDGSDMERVRGWAKPYPNVFLLGWLDAPKIHAAMRFSKVGLAPYKAGAAMSLPNKPFEYMAGKLAILSSIDGELTHLLKDHNCGLSYKSYDKKALKAHIIRLQDDLKLTQEMGERGHNLFLDKFEATKVFQNASNHIRKVILSHRKVQSSPAQNFTDKVTVLPKQEDKCP